MITDGKVITTLAIVAMLLFIAFWLVEGLPILG
jgi:hypothetical protein